LDCGSLMSRRPHQRTNTIHCSIETSPTRKIFENRLDPSTMTRTPTTWTAILTSGDEQLYFAASSLPLCMITRLRGFRHSAVQFSMDAFYEQRSTAIPPLSLSNLFFPFRFLGTTSPVQSSAYARSLQRYGLASAREIMLGVMDENMLCCKRLFFRVYDS
jgi:hypothetical protein